VRGEPSSGIAIKTKESRKKCGTDPRLKNRQSQDDPLASPERPRMSFVNEALKVENFPFVVLLLLATISLISRIWLMLR
jgi:hypothetical protein